MKEEETFVNLVIELYKEKKWREIIERYHDHPERNKLQWVYPSEGNFDFLKMCIKELNCDRILSIGCGSGLLEWMITEVTGIPVSGVEVESSWWNCKYAPPTFIPLLYTPFELSQDIINLLRTSQNTALLFCYFINGPAFKEYLKYYSGNVIIIIGPGEGKDVHTDPKPFGDVSKEWTLYKFQEVRDSKDFIAIYSKNKTGHSNNLVNYI